MKKRLRVLVLTSQEVTPPESARDVADKEVAIWKTEYDVVTALREMGHEVEYIGGIDDLAIIRRRLFEWKPDIVFNLMEEFRGEGIYVPYVLGYLELMRTPFTGCNPAGLLVADNKPLMKKILHYHRIAVPDFAIFPWGRTVRVPRRLSYPLIVKSATEHGSAGISQASVVASDDKLIERVIFIHEQLGTDAIAEEYIEGRELYVGVVGNKRLETLPVWEFEFGTLTQNSHPIASRRAKWDLSYQKRHGITSRPAAELPEGVEKRLLRRCKRVFRLLGLTGYARMDFRLTHEGKLYLLEPNPNPDLAIDEDFSEAAFKHGWTYEQMIQKILNLGLRAHMEWSQAP